MKVHWELEDGVLLEASFSPFGKEIVTVDGREVVNQRGVGTSRKFNFEIGGLRQGESGGVRNGEISARPQLLGGMLVELRVIGRLIAPTPKQPLKCPGCRGEAQRQVLRQVRPCAANA